MKSAEIIKRTVLKWRRAYWLSAGADILAGALVLVFGFFIILIFLDSVLYLKSGIRKMFFFSFCFFLLFRAFRSVKTYLFHLKLENFAPEIEKKEPSLSKHIGPAINFILMPKSENASQVFIDEHLNQTYEKIKAVGGIRFSPFDFENFKFKLWGSFCLAIGLAGLWITNPLAAQRAVFPFLGDEIENIMTISPGNATIVEGAGARIKVSWKKNSGLMPVLQIKGEKGPWISVNWDKQSFLSREYGIKKLKKSVSYRLKYRSMASRVYRLNVRPYPQIEDINFAVIPPRYLDRKKETYSYIPARLSAIEASKIRIGANVSETDAKIIMRIKDGLNKREKHFFKNSFGRFSASLNAYNNLNIEFEAVAGDGLANPQKMTQEINIIKDMPPSVDILSPLFEIETPQGGGIKIIYRADDDFGLSAAELRAEFRFDGKPRKEYGFLRKLEDFKKKNIKEFVGEKYVFMPHWENDFEAYLYIRVSDDFPVGGKKSRWTESLPIKIKVKNFQKNHYEALAGLFDMKRDLTEMAEFEKDAAFKISGGSAPFKNSDFMKRWETLKKLSAKVLSSLEKDPYFNEGLKGDYEMLDEDINYMANALAKKAVREFDKGNYKNSASVHKSMESFLNRGLKKIDDLLNMQSAKDLEFKADKWEASVSRISSALSGMKEGEDDKKLWKDFSEVMKNLSREMSELGKMLSEREYDDSFDDGKKFQIPIKKASGLADRLRNALESGNLQNAIDAARDLLEEIKKTRQVFSEYSDFALSTRTNAEKNEELLKIRKLWGELRDNEAETFYKNADFEDALAAKINLKREEDVKKISKSSIEITKISKTSSTPGVEIKLIGQMSSTPGVEEVVRWRESLKRNIDSLKKNSESVKNPEIKKLMKEMNFSLILSSGIEKDLKFFDLADKTFFIDSSSSQKDIIAAAYKIEEKIELMQDEFLSFSAKARKSLSKAIVEMTAAVSDLENLNMKGGLKHQIRALEELDLGKDMMDKNMQKRENISTAKRGAPRGGREGGAEKRGGFGAGHSGGRLDKSGVKLPEDGAYRPSKEIREKVMESLGEKYPQKSKKMILDYLRKISE